MSRKTFFHIPAISLLSQTCSWGDQALWSRGTLVPPDTKEQYRKSRLSRPILTNASTARLQGLYCIQHKLRGGWRSQGNNIFPLIPCQALACPRWVFRFAPAIQLVLIQEIQCNSGRAGKWEGLGYGRGRLCWSSLPLRPDSPCSTLPSQKYPIPISLTLFPYSCTWCYSQTFELALPGHE